MIKEKCCIIDFAVDSNGKKLADEFLKGVNVGVAAKFRALFKELEASDKGYIPNIEKMKKLEGDSSIWELKVKIKNIGNFRIFCFRKGYTLYLTHGFHKKKERTQKTEIARALSIRSRYCS